MSGCSAGATAQGYIEIPATHRHTDRQTDRQLNKVLSRGDGSSTAAKISADLRPSADGSTVHTSLVAGSG